MGCTTAHLLGILQISVAARASLRKGCCSDCVDTCGGGASLWRRRSWFPGSVAAAGSRTRYLAQKRPWHLEAVAARSGRMMCRERRRQELPVLATARAQSDPRGPWLSSSWVHGAWSRTCVSCVSLSTDTLVQLRASGGLAWHRWSSATRRFG
jgi:hypothetical protein